MEYEGNNVSSPTNRKNDVLLLLQGPEEYFISILMFDASTGTLFWSVN